MKKLHDNENWEFKQKQELELQAFLKKQREEASAFKTGHMNQWNDLKERHTQETWKLFGAKAPANSRHSITNLWDHRPGSSSHHSSRNSPWSPSSTSATASPTSWAANKNNAWSPSNGDSNSKDKSPMQTYWNS